MPNVDKLVTTPTLSNMTTHFITAEIDLQETPLKLQQNIEAALQKRGQPLRWSITHLNTDKQKAHVEAVVTVH